MHTDTRISHSLAHTQRSKLAELVEDVIDHQIARLSSYKEAFPHGRPTSGLRDSVEFLRFALDLAILRDDYVRTYAPLDELLRECAKVLMSSFAYDFSLS